MYSTFKSAAKLHFGASYYPEHWPEERWPVDIQLMKEAGFTVVRMGEFAWSSLEPSAGEFRLDWLEQVIDLLAAEEIATVLGTPTAAPPPWLTHQYPDLLAMTETGQRVQIGNRCHYCVNSPDLHTAVERLVKALADRFGHNPNVIGWQFDNEFHRVCYCGRCQKLFQDFLQDRYGTLENLNERWSTAYWSQTYTTWEQIPIPIGPHNPGLMLEFKHFVTESYRKFQHLQSKTLKPHLLDGVWTTHNFMNWFTGYDHYIMSEDLDIASWDWYVGMGHHDYLYSGGAHDLVRGFKKQNFWLIETQPGSVNWKAINNSLNKGEARAMAWHAVAHGADAVIYWQWRSAYGGQEQMHGSLVDQSGRTRLFYEEARQIGQEFSRTSDLLAGSDIKASVAMLHDYDNLWAIQWQPHHRDFNYIEHFNLYYKPLAAQNVPVDIISGQGLRDSEQLNGYKLVIAPTLLLQYPAMVAVLREYVFDGGHLVLTVRGGMKDEYNALLPLRQPGELAEIAGIEVDEYYALQNPVPVEGNLFRGQSWVWAERLTPIETGRKKALAIARYGKSNGWLDDEIAISVCSYGKGLVYYVGVCLDEHSQKALLTRILKTAAVTTISAPPGIGISSRVRTDGEIVYIVINHANAENVINMPWPVFDHLSGVEISQKLKLAPYGVALVTQKKNQV